MDRDELITALTNSNVKLATRLEQLTKAFSDVREDLLAVKRELAQQNDTRELERHEIRLRDGAIGERLAVVTNEVSHVEKAVREITGAHPRVDLDITDSEKTDRTIGKVVRGVLSHRVLPWLVSAGLGIWHLAEKLIGHGR
jgi:hypothetical protein